jgi:hypothetical protein
VQGLGDLAAHLVAFHNMGASPTNDDPFRSGVKVDFDDGTAGEGDTTGEASPRSAHGQPQAHAAAAAALMEQEHAFDSSNGVCPCCTMDQGCRHPFDLDLTDPDTVSARQASPLNLGDEVISGEGEMFAEICLRK